MSDALCKPIGSDRLLQNPLTSYGEMWEGVPQNTVIMKSSDQTT